VAVRKAVLLMRDATFEREVRLFVSDDRITLRDLKNFVDEAVDAGVPMEVTVLAQSTESINWLTIDTLKAGGAT
jgi:hypothetical protein